MPPERSNDASVLVLIGELPSWPSELLGQLVEAGFRVIRLLDMQGAVELSNRTAVAALVVHVSSLSLPDRLALRRLREARPELALIAVSRVPGNGEMKQALEVAATAFLSWPASAARVIDAVRIKDGEH